MEELRARSDTSQQNQIFAAVGGRRVGAGELETIQKEVRQIAESFGYPSNASRSGYSGFDTEISIYFGERLEMPDGEAYRPQTWAFISMVLLPDVVKWRFPGFGVSRCTGGRRDCFQRLWLRARAFDLGSDSENRWVLLKNLTEDSFVSIMERPSLAGNKNICQALGAAWMRTAASVGRSRMEEVNRRAIKRIRARGTLIFLDALSYVDLKKLIEQSYQAEAS